MIDKDRESRATVRAIQFVGRRYVVIEAKTAVDTLHSPGQFTKVTFEDSEGSFERFYSIASAPRSDGSLDLCIILDDQRLRQLIANWHVGTTFLHSEPAGKFHVPVLDRDVVCIAGGSGITPLRAIIEDRVQRQASGQTLLLYGCQSDDEIPFYDSLETLSRTDSRVKLRFFADENPAGRAKPGRPLDHLGQFILKDAEYLLCGPPAFMEAARSILEQNGIQPEAIHQDRY